MWEARTWINRKVVRVRIRAKVSAELIFSCRFLRVVISTDHALFTLSLRATCYFTESIIGHAVCYSEMTLEHIYLKMMNSVVSSRLSGAARPGCPPPLYPPTEVAYGHGSVCARVRLKTAATEKEISSETHTQIREVWGRRATERIPKLTFVCCY